MTPRDRDSRDSGSDRVASGGSKFHAGAVLGIVAVVACAYMNSLEVPFVFDDRPNISENPHIRIEGLAWSELWSAGTLSRAHQRPIANISFALNHLAGGDDVRGYHFVNVCIHLLNGILVYALAFATIRRPGAGRARDLSESATLWIPLAAALLFVSHPIQTQAVTYLVQRMTSLATLFYLSALLLYIAGRTSSGGLRRAALWGAGLACWLLALGTKQNTATLPILVFLYEWYFFRDLRWPWLKRSLTVALPAVVVVGAVVLVYLGDSPWERLVRGYGERDFTMGERLLTQPRVLMLYLGLVAWPLPSRLSLTHDISTSHSLLDPATTFASVLVVIALLISVVLTARRHRIVSFCIAWVLLHLSIESSVVPLEMAYEHRMYLPMLGVSLLVAWAVLRAVRGERLALVLIGGLVLALTFATQQRNRVWQDTRSVWGDVLAKYPNDVRAHNNLGDAHEEAGDFVAALAAFDNAIRINPIYQKAYVNRGVFYASQGKTIRALEDLSRAIDIDPGDLTWWPVYGEAHQNRGAVYMQLGKYEPAIDDLTRAIELDPSDDMAYSNRSVAHAALGRFDSAVRDGRRAVELNPNSASARNNLAWILATARDPEIRDGDDSVRHATRACELTEWKDAGNLDTLAAAHAEAGDFDSAIRVTRQALETVRASGGAPELIAVFQAHLAAFESNQPLRYP